MTQQREGFAPNRAIAPPVSNRPVAQRPVAQSAVGRHPVGQHPVGRHPVGQHPVGQHPVGQHPVVQHPVGQHPVGQRGFALLIVLLTMGFLALIGTQLMAAARSDTALAANLKQEAALEAAADGAVAHVMFALQAAHDPQFQPGGAARDVRIGETTVLVRVESERDRVNLNTASATLLRALIVQAGAAPETADPLAAAILEWRTAGANLREGATQAARYRAAGLTYTPPGSAFRSVEELNDVLGMTPGLFARLEPHVTVLTDRDPDMTTRDPLVSRALSDASGIADAAGARNTPDEVLRIVATAIGRDDARYALVVVASADFQTAPPRVNILLRQRLPAPPKGVAVADRF